MSFAPQTRQRGRCRLQRDDGEDLTELEGGGKNEEHNKHAQSDYEYLPGRTIDIEDDKIVGGRLIKEDIQEEMVTRFAPFFLFRISFQSH